MSGPFTNVVEQLVEQVNWLQTDKGITWDNMRYGFNSANTDSQGKKWIDFFPPFPRETLGFSATLGFDGGVRNWEMGAFWVTTSGFEVQIGLAGSFGGYVSGTGVGVYWVAWGR